MNTYNQDMRRFVRVLEERSAELRRILAQSGHHLADASPSQFEVQDLKDLAASSAQDALDDSQAGRAARELTQVTSALRRLRQHSFGRCLDCGAEIPLERLEAMPSTPFCSPCQEAFERRDRPAPRA